LPPEILTCLRDYENAEIEVSNLQVQLAQAPGAAGQSANRGRMSRQAEQRKAASSAANASYRTNLQNSLNSAKTRLNTLKSQISTRAAVTARPHSFFVYPHVRAWEYQTAAVATAAPK
jgi:hypothetical protein